MTTAPSTVNPVSGTSKPLWNDLRDSRLLLLLALLMTAGAGLATLAGLAARLHWTLDLFTHWPVQIACGTALPLVLLLAMKRWWLAVLPGAIIVWQCALIAPLYWPPDRPATAGTPLKLMLSNVYTGNRNAALLLELIEREQPDIVALLEIDPWWSTQLEATQLAYPHRVLVPRSDNFGIALLSRHPLEAYSIHMNGPADIPSIRATVDIGAGGPLEVIATHPLPPVNAAYTAMRDQQIRQLNSGLLAMSSGTIILGDLNTTSWSPAFKRLFEGPLELQDTRQGFGVQATWPADSRVMRIPIDHILATREWVTLDHRIGPAIGSDHLPVLVKIARRR